MRKEGGGRGIKKRRQEVKANKEERRVNKVNGKGERSGAGYKVKKSKYMKEEE